MSRTRRGKQRRAGSAKRSVPAKCEAEENPERDAEESEEEAKPGAGVTSGAHDPPERHPALRHGQRQTASGSESGGDEDDEEPVLYAGADGSLLSVFPQRKGKSKQAQQARGEEPATRAAEEEAPQGSGEKATLDDEGGDVLDIEGAYKNFLRAESEAVQGRKPAAAEPATPKAAEEVAPAAAEPATRKTAPEAGATSTATPEAEAGAPGAGEGARQGGDRRAAARARAPAPRRQLAAQVSEERYRGL